MRDIHAPLFKSGDLQRGLDAFQSTGPGSAAFLGK
jgi:hypothetical protein